MMKKISEKRKKVYTGLIAFFGIITFLVLATTLYSLDYMMQAEVDPTLLLVISSIGVVVFALCIWRLRKLEVIDDSRSTK